MKLYRLCVIVLAFSQSTLRPHGFGNCTYVNLNNGHQQKIHFLCARSLRTKTKVASYNTHSHTYSRHTIKRCGQSKTNCYVRLKFDPDHSAHSDNDIVCTPAQEFYHADTKQWIPAYQLNPGDKLLSLGNKTQSVTYVKLVKKPIAVYTIEVDHCHTFFVGKHNVLTHNMALPIAWVAWLNIPLGAVIGGTGSFFGPVTCGVSCVLAGAFALAWYGVFHSQIPHYRITAYDSTDFERLSNYSGCVVQPCLPEQLQPNSPACTQGNQIVPPNAVVGPCLLNSPNSVPPLSCGNIQMQSAADLPANQSCNHADQNPYNPKHNTCGTSLIEPIALTALPHLYTQQNTTVPNSSTPRYNGPWARNWKEFFDTCPVGQQYKHLFDDIRKQNPKDGTPLKQLLADIPGAEMFKEGNVFAPDRSHKGDHFEVWDAKGNWIGVANLDGSKNHKKSNAEKDPHGRNIKRII